MEGGQAPAFIFLALPWNPPHVMSDPAGSWLCKLVVRPSRSCISISFDQAMHLHGLLNSPPPPFPPFSLSMTPHRPPTHSHSDASLPPTRCILPCRPEALLSAAAKNRILQPPMRLPKKNAPKAAAGQPAHMPAQPESSCLHGPSVCNGTVICLDAHMLRLCKSARTMHGFESRLGTCS